MIEKSMHPQDGIIFSFKDHTASVKKAARIMKAKFIAYRFSKWMIVTLLCFGLLTAGTLHATAGSYKSSGGHKSVKASARGGIRTGGSHSKASVRNNNSVHINNGRSGGGGGHFRAIKRGSGGKNHRNNNNKNNNHKNGNNGNGGNSGGKKKVVRKHVNNFETNIDQTVFNKNINKYYPPSDNDYDNCEADDCQDYSEDFGDWSDDCGCWNDTNEEMINNNTLTNDSYNSQYVEVRN